MPSGMPIIDPGRVDSSWVADSPAVTCWGLAPSAWVTADAWRLSAMVAQVISRALITAITMTLTVMTTYLGDSFVSRVVHNGGGVEAEVLDEDGDDPGHGHGHAEGAEGGASGSCGRRRAGRGGAGSGSRVEMAISTRPRLGCRAWSANASMVVVRVARIAGAMVARTDIARATPMTAATVDTAIGGVPAVPSSPSLGWVTSGAITRPRPRSGGGGDYGDGEVLDQ